MRKRGKLMELKDHIYTILKASPPVGVPDKAIWIQMRIRELRRAIREYEYANIPAPQEWIDEYLSYKSL